MERSFECINASGDKTEVFVYGSERFGFWYCVTGGTIVNKTYDEFYDGIEIEKINDENEGTFTWTNPIESIEELALAVIS